MTDSSDTHAHRPVAATPAVKDPTCGIDVGLSNSKHHIERDDITYHFCSESC